MDAYRKIMVALEPTEGKLVAVSKTHPIETIKALYEKGQRDFGENRHQELVEKYEALPKDIRWHFIGHLQTNKVKYIAPFVYLIHAVDSLKLLKEINKQAQRNDRTIKCLLQFKIAEEDSKYGLELDDFSTAFSANEMAELSNVELIGVMGMATFTDNKAQIRQEFQRLKSIYDQLKADPFKDADQFTEVSMGMSGDYQIALEEGSTMVRVGSLLFGERQY